jgi:hypothetical protein
MKWAMPAMIVFLVLAAVSCQPAPPAPPSSGETGAVAMYHTQGEQTPQTGPFVRCTRPGDYLDVTVAAGRKKTILLGVRVLLDDPHNPRGPGKTFTAIAGGKELAAVTQKLPKGTSGAWAVYWEAPPGVDAVRINQTASVRFEFATQVKERGQAFHWAPNPEPWRTGENPADPNQPCYP